MSVNTNQISHWNLIFKLIAIKLIPIDIFEFYWKRVEIIKRYLRAKKDIKSLKESVLDW